MVTLLDECITKLMNSPDKCEILNPSDGEMVLNQFFDSIPFTQWGRIDWAKLTDKISISADNNIINDLKNRNKNIKEPIFIIWDEASLPVIKSGLQSILSNLDYVTAVSFDTWLYCPDEGWVLELFHGGKKTLGFEAIK